MNTFKTLLFLLFPVVGCTQSNLVWRQFEIDRLYKYPIDFEDGIYLSDFEEPNDTIRASISVRNEEHVFSKIKLSSASLAGDTLRIHIHTTTPAYHHEYQIIIANGRYKIEYRFSGGGGVFDEVLRPIETDLKLNSSQFRKGDVIRGYTQFKTNCVKPCNDGYFIANGNFKAVIR